MYLGTSLTPREYYLSQSDNYNNPHAKGIEYILNKIVINYPFLLHGKIIDLGCGDGLVTKILSKVVHGPFLGLDSSPQMVARYIKRSWFSCQTTKLLAGNASR